MTEETKKPITILKTVAPTEKSFTANGTVYTISDKISTRRYELYERFGAEFSFGTTFEELFANLRSCYEHLNKMELVKASVLVNNMMIGVAGAVDKKRVSLALKFCTLFINGADEDITQWDETLMQKKIDDWNAEGIEASSFFFLAATFESGYQNAYQHVTGLTSEQVREIIRDASSNPQQSES